MDDIFDTEDREKSLYLKQIRYLDEQLERSQLKHDELEKENKSLVSRYKTLEADKKDIVESLKHSKAVKEKKVEELLEELESQQEVAEQDREALKMQHGQLMQQVQDQISELNSQSSMRTLMFQAEKEQLMSDIESLKEQLVNQQEEHEAAIVKLKANAELERENVVEETQTNMELYLEERMLAALEAERETQRENMEQMQFLMKENEALWRIKGDLQANDKNLNFTMEKLQKILRQTQLESRGHKTEKEQLMKKCQKLKDELQDCRVTLKTIEDLQTKIETLNERLDSLEEQVRQRTLEADRLKATLQEERTRKTQLETVIQEGVIILRHVLADRERTPGAEQKMQRLLEILESPAPQGADPARHDDTAAAAEKSVGGGQDPQTSGSEPARSKTLNLVKEPQFLLAKYRPGDLGLVPRPRWKRKPAASGTTAAAGTAGTAATAAPAARSSSNNKPPLNRKPRSPKTSSSGGLSDPAPPAAQIQKKPPPLQTR